MPVRKGGSFVMKDGEPTLKHRTRPRERKPKPAAATATATQSPTKADTKRAAVKKESKDADA